MALNSLPRDERIGIARHLETYGYFIDIEGRGIPDDSYIAAIKEFQLRRAEPSTGILTQDQRRYLLDGNELERSISSFFDRGSYIDQTLLTPEFSITAQALATVFTYEEIQEIYSGVFLAPTNHAWRKILPEVHRALFNSNNKSILQKIMRCGIIRDIQFESFRRGIFPSRGIFTREGMDFVEQITNEAGCTYVITFAAGRTMVRGLNGEVLVDHDGRRSNVIAVATSVLIPQGLTIPVATKASRLFAGPGQYPPRSFAAYGILAFGERAVEGPAAARHEMICQAYLNKLPHVGEVPIATDKQIVTVWPVDSDAGADRLNRMPRGDLCTAAVDQYGLVMAKSAISSAIKAGLDLDGEGPFLLAWAPTSLVGEERARILALDMSDLTTAKQAQEVMRDWSAEIEGNPDVWNNGWSLKKLTRVIQFWTDKHGTKMFGFAGID